MPKFKKEKARTQKSRPQPGTFFDSTEEIRTALRKPNIPWPDNMWCFLYIQSVFKSLRDDVCCSRLRHWWTHTGGLLCCAHQHFPLRGCAGPSIDSSVIGSVIPKGLILSYLLESWDSLEAYWFFLIDKISNGREALLKNSLLSFTDPLPMSTEKKYWVSSICRQFLQGILRLVILARALCELTTSCLRILCSGWDCDSSQSDLERALLRKRGRKPVASVIALIVFADQEGHLSLQIMLFVTEMSPQSLLVRNRFLFF